MCCWWAHDGRFAGKGAGTEAKSQVMWRQTSQIKKSHINVPQVKNELPHQKKEGVKLYIHPVLVFNGQGGALFGEGGQESHPHPLLQAEAAQDSMADRTNCLTQLPAGICLPFSTGLLPPQLHFQSTHFQNHTLRNLPLENRAPHITSLAQPNGWQARASKRIEAPVPGTPSSWTDGARALLCSLTSISGVQKDA